MDMEDIYKELNKKVGFADSNRLANIWRMLCTDEEAEVANSLPGSVEDVSKKSGKNVEKAKTILHSLFLKGVAFKSIRDGVAYYRLARNVVQLHDASILWKDATEDFFDEWKRIMDGEFNELMKGLPEDFTLPPFMRVIPISQTIEPQSEVLRYEECAKLIDESEVIAVAKCPCRLTQKNCNKPLEACILLNRGAEHAIERGSGRAISREDALDILKRSEGAGLVHMQENKSTGNVICNCCSCCCEMFRLMKHSGKKWILSPSRYLANVNEKECTSCGACIGICPVEALSLNDDDIAEVSRDNCLGCGLCATVCAACAITINPVRPVEHIPLAQKGTGTY